jgi:hypothetical protein
MNNNLYNSDGLYRGLFSQKPDPKPWTKQSMQQQQKHTHATHQDRSFLVKLWYRLRGK